MRVLVLAAFLVSGCAHTAEGIALETVDASYTSAKAPVAIAGCLKDLMHGLDVAPKQDGSFSVSNRNQFGAIIQNWLIKPAATGSTIEFRRSNKIAPGMTEATRCY